MSDEESRQSSDSLSPPPNQRKLSEEKKEKKAKPGSETIVLRVTDPNSSDFLQFRVKKTATLGKIFAAYCKAKQLDEKSLRFIFDGQRLNAASTPLAHEMEDNDMIEAYSEQQGGDFA